VQLKHPVGSLTNLFMVQENSMLGLFANLKTMTKLVIAFASILTVGLVST
jgi:hypothetical protein